MSLAKEEKLLRRWVEQQRPFGRGHTYSPSLRRRILMFVDLAKSAGISERECCKAIGVSHSSVASWRRGERPAPEASEALVEVSREATRALVPVEVTPSPVRVGASLSVVTPRGFRVEGLSLEQTYSLLRELECC